MRKFSTACDVLGARDLVVERQPLVGQHLTRATMAILPAQNPPVTRDSRRPRARMLDIENILARATFGSVYLIVAEVPIRT